MKRCCFSGAVVQLVTAAFRLTASQVTLVRLPFPTDSHETTSPSVRPGER